MERLPLTLTIVSTSQKAGWLTSDFVLVYHLITSYGAWTKEKKTRFCPPIFNFGELDSELPEVKTMNI